MSKFKSEFLGRAVLSLLCVCLVFACGACNPTVQDCVEHSYGEWKTDVAATCVKAGTEYRECSVCGRKETKVVAALGHDVDREHGVTTKPTCTEDGSIVYSCSRCDYTETTVLESPGHSFPEHGEVTKAPKCEVPGEETFLCETCGTPDIRPIPALKHQWQTISVIKEATCWETGLRSANCPVCGKTEENQVVPKLEHDWDEKIIEAATCTKDGSKELTCKRPCCSDKNTTHTEKIPALGHNYPEEYTIEKAPICEANGQATKHCTTCGQLGPYYIIYAHGHNYVWEVTSEPTADKAGSKHKVCEYCHKEESGSTTEIPQIGQNTAYSVTLLDPARDVYIKDATVEIYDGTNKVDEYKIGGTNGNKAEFTLETKDYKVKITGLANGYYTQNEFYDLSHIQSDLTIILSAKLRQSNTDGEKYSVGDIIADYEFDYFYFDGGTIKEAHTSFAQILREKQGILFNFFYTTCNPCRSETPTLATASNNNERTQVIMVTAQGMGDDDSKIKSFMSTYAAKSSIIFVKYNDTVKLNTLFYDLVGAYPTTVIVDCNGQLIYRHEGSTSSFPTFIKNYISTRYSKMNFPIPADEPYETNLDFPAYYVRREEQQI